MYDFSCETWTLPVNLIIFWNFSKLRFVSFVNLDGSLPIFGRIGFWGCIVFEWYNLMSSCISMAQSAHLCVYSVDCLLMWLWKEPLRLPAHLHVYDKFTTVSSWIPEKTWLKSLEPVHCYVVVQFMILMLHLYFSLLAQWSSNTRWRGDVGSNPT